MKITYAVSQWNFYHYTRMPSLERIIKAVRELGFGIELWGQWQEEDELFDEIGRQRVKPALGDMPVSLHTAGAGNFDAHKKQIDAAECLGAGVVVIHPDDLYIPRSKDLDAGLARDVVAYASEHKVRIALENGPLAFVAGAIEKVDGLWVCFDVGHVYFTDDPISRFIDAFKDKLIHLHLQDFVLEREDNLAFSGRDHFTVGTGSIPREDWELLGQALRDIDFNGMGVFEIRPRTPFQTAVLSKVFMDDVFKPFASSTLSH